MTCPVWSLSVVLHVVRESVQGRSFFFFNLVFYVEITFVNSINNVDTDKIPNKIKEWITENTQFCVLYLAGHISSDLEDCLHLWGMLGKNVLQLSPHPSKFNVGIAFASLWQALSSG